MGRLVSVAVLLVLAACADDKGPGDSGGTSPVVGTSTGSGTGAASGAGTGATGTGTGMSTGTGTGIATGTGTGASTGTGTGASTGTGTGASTGTGTGATGTGTGGTITPSTVSAVCAPTVNPLRFSCDVTVTPPQEADIYFWVNGTATEYHLSSEAVQGVHTIVLFMMKPSTVYDWRAQPRLDPTVTDTGSFTTGALAGGCDVNTTITGTSSVPYIVAQSPCTTDANVIIIDQDGDVVWCEDFSPTALDPMIEGAALTEDNTIMAVLADHVIEKDLLGNELLRLERGVDFQNHVHHDLFRKDGLTYVLFNEVVSWYASNYTLDGFYVFDGTTFLGEWHLFDHFQPAGGIGWPGQDYSHANSIWVDDGGEAFISFRHLSAIARVVSDTSSLDFGDILWRLAGEGSAAEFGSDYEITTSIGGYPDFERQHNVHYLPNGNVALFDNRASISDLSRLAELHLDPATGYADVVNTYSLPFHCDFQGGAWHTAGGNPIATCAPLRRGYEFDVGNPASRWDMLLACSNGLNSYVPRFIPWEGPW